MPCVCSGREGVFLESNLQYCGVLAWQGKRPMGRQNHRHGGGGRAIFSLAWNRWITAAWRIPASGSKNSSRSGPATQSTDRSWWVPAWAGTCRPPRPAGSTPAACSCWRLPSTCQGSKNIRRRTSRFPPPSCTAGTMQSCRSRTVFVGRASIGAALHLLDSEHRLEDQIETICALLRAFLGRQHPPQSQP